MKGCEDTNEEIKTNRSSDINGIVLSFKDFNFFFFFTLIDIMLYFFHFLNLFKYGEVHVTSKRYFVC